MDQMDARTEQNQPQNQAQNRDQDHNQNLEAHDDRAGQEGKLPAERNGGEPTRSRLTFQPRVDIFETEEALVLVADVPGARPDAADVTLEGRDLTLRAEVNEDAPGDMSPIRREYQVGDYERRFQLAGDFDTEHIDADLKNGV